MTNYHLAGLASAFFVTLSLTGLALQLKFIRNRKRQFVRGELANERPTSAISLNRFSASYLGFYSLLVYGLCLQRLDHYLVWPRVVAVVLLLAILHAIMIDRKGIVSTGVFAIAVILFISAAAIRMVDSDTLANSVPMAQALIAVATVLFLQGAIHQVIKIRRGGRSGGLSLPMHQLFFVKDLFSTLFGLAMGIQQGWPLLMFNGISMVMQCIIMWHFRWVKISAIAHKRRDLVALLD